MTRKNPYKAGSPCYLAYEFGYTDAIEDALEKLITGGEKVLDIG